VNTPNSTRHNPDAELMAIIRRHEALWTEWDLADDDDPRIPTFCRECVELERKIVATPAFTADGLDGKRRVAELAELQSWDDLGIVDTIFALDGERVVSAR
jgi:hypothetical protein